MTHMRNGAIKPPTDHSLGRLRLAPSIFSVPRKDLSHDFSSQVALEASYHAAKHFFSIGPFRLQFSTSYLFQIWSFPHVTPIHVAIEGTSSIAAGSSCRATEFQFRLYPSYFDESPWNLHIGDPQAAAAE